MNKEKNLSRYILTLTTHNYEVFESEDSEQLEMERT